jgi:hypothetical protein
MEKQFLDKTGLETLLKKFKNIFGLKFTLDTSIENLNTSIENRRKYLLEIDYEKELAFNTDWIVGDNAPYVGSAVVGQTYVA